MEQMGGVKQDNTFRSQGGLSVPQSRPMGCGQLEHKRPPWAPWGTRGDQHGATSSCEQEYGVGAGLVAGDLLGPSGVKAGLRIWGRWRPHLCRV